MSFNRWGHRAKHSLPFVIFKQYHEELSDYIWANEAANKYVYKWLGKHGASLNDNPKKHLYFPKHVWNFSTLKEWSDSYNDVQNWIYLNAVMAMSANLETFIDAIVALAIESDPGVLLNASKTVDGTVLLKRNHHVRESYKERASRCTHGNWTTRINSFNELFGSCPEIILNSMSTLEAIRKMRNNVGHAFGRDIEEARDFKRKTKLPQERISLNRVKKYLNCIYDVASTFDSFLMDNHIGEYQVIIALHDSYSELKRYMSAKEKGKAFRKIVNTDHWMAIGKDATTGLIEYYEKIR